MTLLCEANAVVEEAEDEPEVHQEEEGLDLFSIASDDGGRNVGGEVCGEEIGKFGEGRRDGA